MCFKNLFKCQTATVEECDETVELCIARWADGMDDKQKAGFWYEICQQAFAILGKVEIDISEITFSEWKKAALTQYPTLTDIKMSDSTYYTTSLDSLGEILTKDWTNLVPYVAQISDCDKFGVRLYSHLCDYYKLNSIIPVWGDTDKGYHGFNLAVVFNENGDLTSRLIEPQTDEIFLEEGPLGKYIPRETTTELGIKKIEI